MRTTIDRAGRVVIPKSVREAAGLDPGAEVDVAFRDGRIELEPATASLRLVKRGRAATIEADAEMPELTSVTVRDVLERARR